MNLVILGGYGSPQDVIAQGYSSGAGGANQGNLITFGLGSALLITQGYSPSTATDFDEDLEAYLLAHLSYTVFPYHTPTAVVLPSVTYGELASENHYHLGGSSGVVTAHYRIEAWSALYSDVVSVVDTVRNLLDGYSGAMGGSIILECNLHDVYDTYDPGVGANDQGVFIAGAEFIVTYRESQP